MRAWFTASVFSLIFINIVPAYAAKPIDLNGQDVSVLREFLPINTMNVTSTKTPQDLETVSQSVDFNHTLHVRLKQNYAGYPVFGGDAVVHVPNGMQSTSAFGVIKVALQHPSSMNGVIYQGLQQDLKEAKADLFTKNQAEKAYNTMFARYEATHGKQANVKNKASRLMVFVDDKDKAHWAFYVSFYTKPDNSMPAIPVYLIDATDFTVYREWDEIKTLDKTEAGGFGGNKKMGQLIYDGLAGHLSALQIERDAKTSQCYLQNDGVMVVDGRVDEANAAVFNCNQVDKEHNNLYWDGSRDAINGGYSPLHDALYAGKAINNIYQTWYGIPALTKNGKPMKLFMVVHSPNIIQDNAFWDPFEEKMFFGDGRDYFYPLTSLGVAAHEISHGFTEQHAQLIYDGESGGMNEAFSDMAAQAAELMAYGHNTWQIGGEITFAKDTALRYMDQPSKDCVGGNEPGLNCSIDHVRNYHARMNVHYSSGIYNRVFYLMGTAPGWDTKKAFDVMVQANRYYWTPSTTFLQGACSVLKAAKDFNYDTTAILKAFADVGVATDKC